MKISSSSSLPFEQPSQQLYNTNNPSVFDIQLSNFINTYFDLLVNTIIMYFSKLALAGLLTTTSVLANPIAARPQGNNAKLTKKWDIDVPDVPDVVRSSPLPLIML